jgi:hypothetical protein
VRLQETGCHVCGTSQFLTLRHRRFCGDSALRRSTFHVTTSLRKLRNSEGGGYLRFSLRSCLLRFHRSENTLKCIALLGPSVLITGLQHHVLVPVGTLSTVRKEGRIAPDMQLATRTEFREGAENKPCHTVHLLDRPVCGRLGTIFKSRQSLLMAASFRAE